MLEVSILLPNWNAVECLRRCVASIAHERVSVNLELIAVDNASTDGATDLLRDLEVGHSWIQCVYNTENVLFARACNQAYSLASAPWLMVVNNDIEFEPGSLARLLGYGYANPEVAVVTPRFVLPDSSFQEAYRRLPTAATVIAHYHKLGRAVDRLFLGRRLQSRYFCRDLSFDRDVDVEQPSASCTLIRRSAVESVGGLFDERFPLLFNDVELSARLLRRGWRSVVLTSARVIHYQGISSRSMPTEEYRRHLYDGMFTYFGSYHPAVMWALIAAWPLRWLSWRLRTHRSQRAPTPPAASDPACRR